jgi:hypothetical protein
VLRDEGGDLFAALVGEVVPFALHCLAACIRVDELFRGLKVGDFGEQVRACEEVDGVGGDGTVEHL